jgi:hypothetical protein
VAGAPVDLHGSAYGEVAVGVPFADILAGGVPGEGRWDGVGSVLSSPTFAPPNPPSTPASLPNRADWPYLFLTIDLLSFVPNPGDVLGFI